MRVMQRIRDIALALSAISAFAVAILAFHFQIGIISITSESMAPALRTGDTALTVPIGRESVREGDVVVLPHPNYEEIFVAHRVVAIDRSRERVVVETKGDANPTKDAWRLELQSAEIPKVRFTVATSRLPFDRDERVLISQLLIIVALLAFALSFRKWSESATG